MASHTSTSTTSLQSGKPMAPPSSAVIKRLQSELLALMSSPTPGLSAFPTTSLTLWTATLAGPSATPYESLTFKLTLSFPSNYPHAPPEVLFKTPIYHPNVDMKGRICLDILKAAGSGGEGGGWSAALNAETVLLSVQSLLGEPNNASPLNGEAAIVWDRDMEEFRRKVLARHQEPEELDA
ncbi:hypothetical protein B0A48_12526 [Cryoendolithus antarcticus]|uniref:Ubiquitin-conjugating enzyme E2 2 n=1 Tax=Cryoendolithus antarcticus TaxID=1507870 RepID=A0A1V8SSB0_9PEZI|nr:hypothetical protein B0A48_12526 [Cryoendolithus antarcticus]